MQEGKGLVLLFGATGNSGFHIALKLLKEEYPVRIFCRSEQKANVLFGDKAKTFEKIVTGNITNDEDLEKAFTPSDQHGEVKNVISALGSPPFVSEAEV